MIRVWIQDGLIAGVHGLPDGVRLRIIDCDTEGTLPEDTKLIEGDDELGAAGYSRAFIQTYDEDTVEGDSTCDECGDKVATVIGCPDGTEICRACFDKGGH